MPTTTPTFPHPLRSARESAGLRQVDLARRAGVTQPLVCGIERGTLKRPVSVVTAKSIAHVLDLDDAWLAVAFGEIRRCQCSPTCQAETFGRYAEHHAPTGLSGWHDRCERLLAKHVERERVLRGEEIAAASGCSSAVVKKYARTGQLGKLVYQYAGDWGHDPPYLYRHGALDRVRELLSTSEERKRQNIGKANKLALPQYYQRHPERRAEISEWATAQYWSGSDWAIRGAKYIRGLSPEQVHLRMQKLKARRRRSREGAGGQVRDEAKIARCLRDRLTPKEIKLLTGITEKQVYRSEAWQRHREFSR